MNKRRSSDKEKNAAITPAVLVRYDAFYLSEPLINRQYLLRGYRFWADATHANGDGSTRSTDFASKTLGSLVILSKRQSAQATPVVRALERKSLRMQRNPYKVLVSCGSVRVMYDAQRAFTPEIKGKLASRQLQLRDTQLRRAWRSPYFGVSAQGTFKLAANHPALSRIESEQRMRGRNFNVASPAR